MSYQKEESNAQKVERILHTYENSLRSVGIDPEGKDLLEVIAELANIIANMQGEVFDLQQEMHNVTRGYIYSPSENRDE